MRVTSEKSWKTDEQSRNQLVKTSVCICCDKTISSSAYLRGRGTGDGGRGPGAGGRGRETGNGGQAVVLTARVFDVDLSSMSTPRNFAARLFKSGNKVAKFRTK